jgi:SulP family sulfate permease
MESTEALCFLVLDFRLVTGLDTSALMSFLKLQRLAKNHGVTVVHTNLPDSITAQLQANTSLNGNEQVQTFSDLDHGIEWCENQIIAYEGLPVKEKRQTLEIQLARNMPSHLDMGKLFTYFEREEIEANTYIIHQGELSNELYFIEEGQVTVQLELEDGHTIRLRTMGVGTVVGEIGLYLSNPRSASVIADMPTTAYRLTAQSLRQLEHDHADIAAAFHRFMIHILAERLNHTDDTMRLLLQ